MIFILGSLLLSVFFIFVFFFPLFYVSEIVISFLPYIVIFSLICLCVNFVLFFKNSKKTKIWCAFNVCLYTFVFILFSIKFNSFYTGEGFQKDENFNTKSGINVLYSNIWYKVKNYDRLLDWVNNYDADVVLMVEFTEDFDDVIGEKLKKKYPYTAHMSFSDKYYGNVIFSKFPVKNLSSEIDIENSQWRYSYFLVNDGVEDYYIYLIHTAAPVSLAHFYMRNNQLYQFVDDFEGQQINRKESDRVMIIGDFNLSPWSYFYDWLEKNLNNMNDLTKKFTILHTWSYNGLQVIASHIDHVFVDDNSQIGNLQVINTNGSDHRGIFISNFR